MTLSNQKFAIIFIVLAALLGCFLAFSTPSVASGQSPATLSMSRNDVDTDQAKLSATVKRAWKSSTPVRDIAELESRLKLPKQRLKSIGITGPLGEIGSAASRMGYWCSGDSCICIGDSDCNDLFSGVCRNPSTGGSCRVTGRVVVCTCNPRSAF